MNTETATFTTVLKRNGKPVPFQKDRIVRAIALAKYEVNSGGANNIERDNKAARYGLIQEDFDRCVELADRVVASASAYFGVGQVPTVEQFQDFVEDVLLEAGEGSTVRAYIKYRIAHATLRPINHEENGLQDYIAVSRYCRYSEKLGRREVWSEAVERVRDMHLRRFKSKLVSADRVAEVINELRLKGIVTDEVLADAGGFTDLETEIRKAFELVTEKRILPSMRSLQFGGQAIEQQNSRMFNCSFGPANRVDFFKEYFHLLLCGCGVGFSVQKHHVAMLPAIASRKVDVELEVRHQIIPDTIEGWADALDQLLDSYFKGYKIEFSYHLIRKRGSILKTSGGTAPGHIPLKKALDRCADILDSAAGRKLRPIEVYDVCMHIAKAVLSGGIRRSATICLFSHDDEEMMAAKSMKGWYSDPRYEQRSASNNSAILVRGEVTREQFDKLFECQKNYGEPGFYFSDDREVGCNPCVEIGLDPRLVVTEQVRDKLISYGYDKPVELGSVLSGFQMCNLTTQSGRTATTPAEFFKQSRYAALIGTLQADYTEMPYLGPITRILNEREALIGVSICGVLDRPKVLLDPAILRRGAEVVKATNAIVAALIGINRAARTTAVKPEGTASLVTNSGSGINPHHSRRYFRRVQANSSDPVYKHFKKHNPHLVERSVYDPNGATDVITFAVEGPEDAIYRADIVATAHLSFVRTVQENWVVPGRAYTTFSFAHHNVSNTINVGPKEWDDVANYIWEYRHSFTGVALLPNSGDKDYAQAPREEVSSNDDIRKWNSLRYNPVNYAEIEIQEDHTAGAEHRGAATACAGGTCELV